MNEIVINILNTVLGLIIGGLAGYCYAYFSGLMAVRKGMQLILRSTLDEMYTQFLLTPPTVDEKHTFEEIYAVYEKLADNGVMDAKHQEVLWMKERQ